MCFRWYLPGDLFEIDLLPKVPKFIRASKEKFSQGIVSITLPARGVPPSEQVQAWCRPWCQAQDLVCKAQLPWRSHFHCSSISNNGELAGLYMGTNQSNIYFSPWDANVRTKTINPELRQAATNPIKDIIFPRNYFPSFHHCR